MLLDVKDVRLRFGGVVALDGVSFGVPRGQITGLIGPNGAGKTTIFNCISRLYTPDEGRLIFEGDDLLRIPAHGIAKAGIARTFQNLGLFSGMSVRDNVLTGGHIRGDAGFLNVAVGGRGARRSETELSSRADELLERLRLVQVADVAPTDLPFGDQKRVELARALMAAPRLLLLDEPASGLTHEEVVTLKELLLEIRRDWDLTMLLVEHHMELVMGISDQVVVMDSGRCIAAGSPSTVRSDPAVIEAYLGTTA